MKILKQALYSVAIIGAAAFTGSSAMANVIAAWDLHDIQTTSSTGWTTVSATTLESGGGSTVGGITLKLTDGTLYGDYRNIALSAINFVEDGEPIQSLTTSAEDQKVYEDRFFVRNYNPKFTISGLQDGQKYAIQWIGTLRKLADFVITVSQDGDSVASITNGSGNSNAIVNDYDVVYSTHYTITGSATDTDVEFAFAGISAGNFNQYGLSGVVISAIPEPGSYALLAGCIGLTWVMLRRRRS
jgi:hypothetical protein